MQVLDPLFTNFCEVNEGVVLRGAGGKTGKLHNCYGGDCQKRDDSAACEKENPQSGEACGRGIHSGSCDRRVISTQCEAIVTFDPSNGVAQKMWDNTARFSSVSAPSSQLCRSEMKREYHRWYSQRLGLEMGVVVYGHWGPPLLGFPTSAGDEWELEGQGLIGALAPLIDAGRVKFFSINSVNWAGFYDKGAHPFHRSYVEAQFDSYIREEVVPFVRAIASRETLLFRPWVPRSAPIMRRTLSSNIPTWCAAASRFPVFTISGISWTACTTTTLTSTTRWIIFRTR